MSEREALRECPFCGGEARVTRFKPTDPVEQAYRVQCRECYGGTLSAIEERAIAAWNRRAEPAAVVAALEREGDILACRAIDSIGSESEDYQRGMTAAAEHLEARAKLLSRPAAPPAEPDRYRAALRLMVEAYGVAQEAEGFPDGYGCSDIDDIEEKIAEARKLAAAPPAEEPEREDDGHVEGCRCSACPGDPNGPTYHPYGCCCSLCLTGNAYPPIVHAEADAAYKHGLGAPAPPEGEKPVQDMAPGMSVAAREAFRRGLEIGAAAKWTDNEDATLDVSAPAPPEGCPTRVGGLRCEKPLGHAGFCEAMARVVASEAPPSGEEPTAKPKPTFMSTLVEHEEGLRALREDVDFLRRARCELSDALRQVNMRVRAAEEVAEAHRKDILALSAPAAHGEGEGPRIHPVQKDEKQIKSAFEKLAEDIEWDPPTPEASVLTAKAIYDSLAARLRRLEERVRDCVEEERFVEHVLSIVSFARALAERVKALEKEHVSEREWTHARFGNWSRIFGERLAALERQAEAKP